MLCKRALLLMAMTGLGLSAQAQSEGVAWRDDLQAAQAEAQQAGKLVLVHFWTPTCGPCKALDVRVFNQPSVAVSLQSQYVPVKVNANDSPELAERFGVTRVPTDVVLSPTGERLSSFVSPAVPMEYVGHLTRLSAAYKSRPGAAFAAATASAPAPPEFKNKAYAQLASLAAAPVTPAPTAPAAAPAPKQEPNPYFPPQVAAAPAPATSAPVTPAKPSRVELPPGSPPLGFEGFCPVTMKNDWRWAEGDVRYGAIHQGRTYLFVSAEAQQTFLADPDAYSPVLSGADPVVAVDQRRTVAGQRHFAVQYPTGSGRFYLFSSQKSLEKFWTNPDAYTRGVERVAAAAATNGNMIR